jgi:hypothetical protein
MPNIAAVFVSVYLNMAGSKNDKAAPFGAAL